MSSTHRFLFEAIQRGDLQTTRHLLERNDDCDMDVDTRCVLFWDQRTPLHQACRFGKLQIARYLIHELKANVDVVDCGDGWTPLYQTCNRFDDTENAMELVKLLLANGANANGKASGHAVGSTLHLACQKRSSTQLVQLLLDHGASINAQDGDGRTPLFNACDKPNPREDVIKLLLANSADRHILNHDGRGPRDLLHPRCHGDKVVSKVFASYDTLSLTAGGATMMEHIQGGAVGLLNPHLSQHQHALAIKAILLVRKLPPGVRSGL